MKSLVGRLEFAAVCLLITVIFAMVPVLVSAAARESPPASSSQQLQDDDMSDSPNAVTRSLGGLLTSGLNLTNTVSAVLDNTATATGQAGSDAGQVATSVGKFALETSTSGMAAASRGIGGGIVAIGHGTMNSFAFAVGLPTDLLGHVAHVSLTGFTIHPADHYAIEKIPVDPSVTSATTNGAAAKPASAVAVPIVIWPIHGAITTLFGVPEPPYQPIHTGIDISDGKAPGITPIHAFMAGTVTQTIHEHIKLGNEVVIDHGGGMTSVYGHLNSISVSVGQTVTTSTIVGYEGTTGVSTGPHLHFEIRINGTPVNPQLYITGNP